MVRRAGAWRAAMLSGVVGAMAMGGLAPARAAAQPPDCRDLLPPAATQVVPASRGITPDDLLRLRDLGPRWRPAEDNFIGLSSDGQQLAFVLTRDDPATNSACRALVALARTPGAKPLILDEGGEPIYQLVNVRGLLTDYGYPALNRPQWSPDGRQVAYLRRDDGITRLWRVSAGGGDARPVSPSGLNIETFAWSADGKALLYGSRDAALRAAMDAIAKEGLSGFLYDRRTVPYNDRVPGPSLPVAYHYAAVELASGVARPASPEEIVRVTPPPPADSASYPLREAGNLAGWRAWTAQDDPSRWMSPVRLWVTDPHGRRMPCPDAVCTGTEEDTLLGLWWAGKGRDLVFLRKIGAGGSQLALFRWHPGDRRVRQILATEDLLAACQPAGETLICTREGSTQPRRLVEIALRSGASRVIFDPNPEFAGIKLGQVERLHWVNAYGIASFGDLVLPPGFRPDAAARQHLPLIIVQYRTRGFLRGATGDEYPIQLFAARGYAVLSVEGPDLYYTREPEGKWHTWQEAERENIKDFHERKSNLSSLVTGVRQVLARGFIDPQRVGITGLSDGSTTVQFALVNTNLFAAAAISSAGTDSQSMIYGGPALIEQRKSEGYPPASEPGADFWGASSLAFKRQGPRVPLLMQLSDHEMLLGLETYTILRDRHWPVELYSFPGEYHLKSQPAHRAAIYRRNLAWFDFWLRGIPSDDPQLAPELARWRALGQEAQQANAADARGP